MYIKEEIRMPNAIDKKLQVLEIKLEEKKKN